MIEEKQQNTTGKKQIRMIGLDLDGTLLTDQKQLTKRTLEAVEAAVAQGVIVLPATGRPYHGIPAHVLQIPGIQYALTSNGARIIDMKTKEAVSETLLTNQEAFDIVSIFRKYHTYIEFFHQGKGFGERSGMADLKRFGFTEAMEHYTRSTRTPVEDIEESLQKLQAPVDKVQALFDDHDRWRQAKEELIAEDRFAVTHASDVNLEIMAKGVHKGIGLVRLGERLGISKEEIMACGDGMNDYDMIQTVGFGVAMGNAVPELKEIADYVTITNEEDGVADAIERFVLK